MVVEREGSEGGMGEKVLEEATAKAGKVGSAGSTRAPRERRKVLVVGEEAMG